MPPPDGNGRDTPARPSMPRCPMDEGLNIFSEEKKYLRPHSQLAIRPMLRQVRSVKPYTMSRKAEEGGWIKHHPNLPLSQSSAPSAQAPCRAFDRSSSPRLCWWTAWGQTPAQCWCLLEMTCADLNGNFHRVHSLTTEQPTNLFCFGFL